MERAQGQLEAELQSLEEEKNRVIEEAFIRAESEMKAVHENLAGLYCLQMLFYYGFFHQTQMANYLFTDRNIMDGSDLNFIKHTVS